MSLYSAVLSISIPKALTAIDVSLASPASLKMEHDQYQQQQRGQRSGQTKEREGAQTLMK